MKKTCIGFIILNLLLGGCAAKHEIQKISQLVEKTISDPVQLECYLGSGSSVTITRKEYMKEILSEIQTIEVDILNQKEDMHISDGDISFIFTDSDGKTASYDFCTSEYFCYDRKYLTVQKPSLVNNLCSMARDFAEMERETTIDNSINTLSVSNQIVDIEFLDNGCEAPNVMILYPTWNSQELVLERVYSIEQTEETSDGLIITCTVGDFYDHDTLQRYLLAIEADQLIFSTVE